MSDREITADLLKSALDDNKVIREGKPLRNCDLRNLAADLEFLRFCYTNGSAMEQKARAELQKSLVAALNALPQIIEGAEKMAELGRRHSLDGGDYSRNEIAKLRQLEKAILAFKITPDPAVLPLISDFESWPRVNVEIRCAPDTTRWQDFAGAIMKDFRAALQAANPGEEIGLTTGGPVSRYLECVIPLVNGERPKGSAVIMHLLRHPADG